MHTGVKALLWKTQKDLLFVTCRKNVVPAVNAGPFRRLPTQVYFRPVRNTETSCFFPKKTWWIEAVRVHASIVWNNIIAHLFSLGQQWREYFPVTAEENWMRNPFTVGEQESLPGLSFETLKSAGRRRSLLAFWMQQHAQPIPFRTRLCAFSLFFQPHICTRKAFSSLAIINTTYRSRMDAEPDLRLKLTWDCPVDIAVQCSQRQAHPSH